MTLPDRAGIDKMKALVEFMVKSIVEFPEAVQVTEAEGEGGLVLQLEVAAEDKGRVIGKQGRVAQAMRTLLRVVATRAGTRVQLDIM